MDLAFTIAFGVCNSLVVALLLGMPRAAIWLELVQYCKLCNLSLTCITVLVLPACHHFSIRLLHFAQARRRLLLAVRPITTLRSVSIPWEPAYPALASANAIQTSRYANQGRVHRVPRY